MMNEYMCSLFIYSNHILLKYFSKGTGITDMKWMVYENREFLQMGGVQGSRLVKGIVEVMTSSQADTHVKTERISKISESVTVSVSIISD